MTEAESDAMRVRWNTRTRTGPPGAHSSPLFIVGAAGGGGGGGRAE